MFFSCKDFGRTRGRLSTLSSEMDTLSEPGLDYGTHSGRVDLNRLRSVLVGFVSVGRVPPMF